MIEHPNSLLVHHCFQAANAGDRQTLRALWADDIVWHVKGYGPWQGEIKGVENIFEYLAELGDLGTTGLHNEIEDVMVSNQRAAVICRSQAAVGDKELDAQYLLIATIVDRRIQNIVTVPIDADRIREFFSEDD